MSIRSIVRYPDPRLSQRAAPITVFDDALRELATDLLDSLRAAPGVGIAGAHIGELRRIVVLDLSEASPAPHFYINPEIIWSSTETIIHDEGSISMPGVLEKIVRPAAVHIRYQDLHGQEHIEKAEGFRAVCHQHEIDQLEGVFWLQRLSALKRDRALKRYKKIHNN